MFRRWRQRKQDERADPIVSHGPSITVTPLPSVTAATQAAAGGSPAEMNRVGIVLKTQGRQEEAAVWFRKAAEAGSNDAMANLATHLMAQGRNTEAAEWFRRAGGPLGEALAARLLADGDGPRRS